mgnify:CR=1 FL=1
MARWGYYAGGLIVTSRQASKLALLAVLFGPLGCTKDEPIVPLRAAPSYCAHEANLCERRAFKDCIDVPLEGGVTPEYSEALDCLTRELLVCKTQLANCREQCTKNPHTCVEGIVWL